MKVGAREVNTEHPGSSRHICMLPLGARVGEAGASYPSAVPNVDLLAI